MSNEAHIQWLSELDSWSRILEQFKEEIVTINNELALIIEGEIYPDILKEVEHFQNILIDKDIVIDFIRNEINAEKTNIQACTDTLTDQLISRSHNSIQKDMLKMQDIFKKTKTEFYTWKSEQISSN
jgi:hypothetical protein